MRPVTATALRRAAFSIAAIVATLAAHGAGGGHVRPTALTPVVMLAIAGMIASSSLAFEADTFHAWTPTRTILTLSGLQLGVHFGLTTAPWFLGLTAHGHSAGTTLGALVWHLAAAAVLGTLLHHGQRLLARVVAAVEALLAVRRSALPRHVLTLAFPDGPPLHRERTRPDAPRGPPSFRSVPA